MRLAAYFENRRYRRRELLTRDEAQRIAAIFAKLPEPERRRRQLLLPEGLAD
jgi:hypothetical protein